MPFASGEVIAGVSDGTPRAAAFAGAPANEGVEARSTLGVLCEATVRGEVGAFFLGIFTDHG
jgi:hypothetical protein